MADLLLRGGIVQGRTQDVAVRDGRLHRIGSNLDPTGYDRLDVTDKLVLPGFVESHIHPDKAFIADRTQGLRTGGPTPQILVAELKKAFTVEDVYRRARRVLELAIRHGCTTMRAHVAPPSTPNAARMMMTPMMSATQPHVFTLFVIGSSPPVLRRM